MAIEVIREKGFYQTTLADVATRAGMTRGAIYGNFKNRHDLLLAVVETSWRPIIPIKQGSTLREHLRLVGEAVVAAAPARRAQALGALSFQIYALTHDDLRSRMAQVNAELYRRGADRLRPLLPPDQALPAEQFARVLHALADGLLLLRFLMPDQITDDLMVAAFEALA